MIRSTLLFLLFAAGVITSQARVPVRADTFDIATGSLRFPHLCQQWGFRVSAGLSMVRPPKDLLENAIQAPLVNIHATFGLPWKLSLEGDLTTILVSNQLALGPQLSFCHANYGVKLGWDLGFLYGRLKQFGFNNSTQGWISYPNISIGYKLKTMAFTLKGEGISLLKVSTKSGENEVTRSKKMFNGGTLALYIEQRIHKNKLFVIGLKDNYVKYYWPTWMLFSTFNRFYHIPELYFSWIL